MKYLVLVFSIGLVLAQTVAPAPSAVPVIGGVPDYIAHGGIVGIVLWFSRQDRADRAAERAQDRSDRATERAEQEKRYADLAQDFRRIVTDNTQAMGTLRDAIMQSAARAER